MINIEDKIAIATERSQAAYEAYLGQKLYYQARRIYSANLTIYALLEKYIYICNDDKRKDVINYMFHLEDWFFQFESAEAVNPAAEDRFVFTRFEHSIAFPSDFIKKLK